PSRPSNGYRILRLFVNVNLHEPRVWVTSEPFAKLFQRYGHEVTLLTRQRPDWLWKFQQRLRGVLRPGRMQRSIYDLFMLRFHDYLKHTVQFQEQCPKRFWHFPPGSAWLAITDTASHAALRGRFALEHSYFVAPDSLALPEEAPAAILQRAWGSPVLNRAA